MTVHAAVHDVRTGRGVSLHDITPAVRDAVAASGVEAGLVAVTSRHTTTALTINEFEPRLVEDVRGLLTRLVPPYDHYMHNDTHLRDCPPDEPENAHSHLAAMLVGSSEVIPVAAGRPVLGRYQAVILVELDGPRDRTVSIQVCGD
jgi:secondary thiamine-phosphate synthase enzyme